MEGLNPSLIAVFLGIAASAQTSLASSHVPKPTS